MCVPGGLMEPLEATEGVEGVERDMGGATIISFFRLLRTWMTRLCAARSDPSGVSIFVLHINRLTVPADIKMPILLLLHSSRLRGHRHLFGPYISINNVNNPNCNTLFIKE